MKKVSLNSPSIELRDSYVAGLKEFISLDPSRGEGVRWDLFENFDLYLEACQNQKEQRGIVGDRVPQTTYWIVFEGKAVGKCTVRKDLTPRLEQIGGNIGYEIWPSFRRKGIATEACRLALMELKNAGLTKAIVTCDFDNLGSRGVLKNNGGKIIGPYEVDNWPKPIVKFVFEL